MSNINEGSVAPNSIEAQALAELQNEGHVIGTGQPDANDGEIKDTPAPPKVEPEKKDEPKAPEAPKDPPKNDRSPTMVEAWKLKVAEDQKAGLEKDVSDLKAKLEEVSKQKTPVTQIQKDDIAAEIKALAGDKDVDVDFLTKFADSILSKAKPSVDVEKTLKGLQDEKELNEQLKQYSDEFETDVAPLVREYQLSDTALRELKSTLRDYAFSDTYAKVPLKEIFAIKQSTFNLTVPKKSSEGKGIKTRANEVVDLENIDEDTFSKLSPEQVEAFASRNTTGWNRPQNKK